MNTKQIPINAYLSKMDVIRSKLQQLQQLAEDHFGHEADNINWGHVGDLNRIDSALDEILEAL